MSRRGGNRLTPVDLLALGLVGLRTRRLRALLSSLGIAISIATIVVVVGVPASSQRALAEQLSRLGTDILQAGPVPNQDKPVLLPPQSVAMVARIGPVSIASAVANIHATVARSDRIAATDDSGLTALASYDNLLPSINAGLLSGRFLDPATDSFPTVVLGSVAAGRLGFDHVPADAAALPQIYVGRQWFTVIGILRPAALAPDLDRAVLVGWNAARTYLGFDGHPTVIYLKSQ